MPTVDLELLQQSAAGRPARESDPSVPSHYRPPLGAPPGPSSRGSRPQPEAPGPLPHCGEREEEKGESHVKKKH